MITIADIQRKHIRGFHRVLDSVSREKKYLVWTEAPPLREVRRFVTEGILHGNPQIVALDSGRVVGWCDITPHQRQTTWHCAALGMGVVKEYRHAGIGGRLIHAALSKAKALGLQRIELEVFEENLPAIALYKSVGFQIEGRKIDAVRISGRQISVLLMALFLKDYAR